MNSQLENIEYERQMYEFLQDIISKYHIPEFDEEIIKEDSICCSTGQPKHDMYFISKLVVEIVINQELLHKIINTGDLLPFLIEYIAEDDSKIEFVLFYAGIEQIGTLTVVKNSGKGELSISDLMLRHSRLANCPVVTKLAEIIIPLKQFGINCKRIKALQISYTSCFSLFSELRNKVKDPNFDIYVDETLRNDLRYELCNYEYFLDYNESNKEKKLSCLPVFRAEGDQATLTGIQYPDHTLFSINLKESAIKTIMNKFDDDEDKINSMFVHLAMYDNIARIFEETMTQLFYLQHIPTKEKIFVMSNEINY